VTTTQLTPTPPGLGAVGPVPPAVRLDGLVKRFGRTVAVAGVDLEVAAGEVVGFLGPNGAGKTTVLRVLTGALRPTSGTVAVQGRDPFSDVPAARRGLGYLPGDLRLPAHLTGREVLDLCARLRGDTGTGERDRLVARFALPLDVPVAALSKGNRQKVGVVQALMGEPAVVLLDEPSSGLDPLAQEVLEQEVRAAARRGAAVLLSSHVLSEVEEVADRVVLLRRGEVVASARLDDLREAAPHDVEVLADGLDVAALQALDGVEGLVVQSGRAQFTATSAALDAVVRVVARGHVRDLRVAPADLERLFLHYYEGDAP
jgi:ABC-2 type transport system ATP-binding protein